jgi:hypothetical protein
VTAYTLARNRQIKSILRGEDAGTLADVKHGAALPRKSSYVGFNQRPTSTYSPRTMQPSAAAAAHSVHQPPAHSLYTPVANAHAPVSPHTAVPSQSSNVVNQSSMPNIPLPAGWSIHRADDSRFYFVNHQSMVCMLLLLLYCSVLCLHPT